MRDDPCACWDLFPAFSDLAGGRPARALDGVSLRPLFKGARPGTRPPLYWEFQGRQAVRDGRWKAVHDARAGTFGLYDLAADPGETSDLAAREPAVAARMRALMRELRTESELFPLVKAPA